MTIKYQLLDETLYQIFGKTDSTSTVVLKIQQAIILYYFINPLSFDIFENTHYEDQYYYHHSLLYNFVLKIFKMLNSS